MCDNPPEFCTETWRVARKQHKCCECSRRAHARGRRIEPGERYLEYRGKWDGDMDTYRVCSRCHRVRKALVKAKATAARAFVEAHPTWTWARDEIADAYCWTFGDLREDLREFNRNKNRKGAISNDI